VRAGAGRAGDGNLLRPIERAVADIDPGRCRVRAEAQAVVPSGDTDEETGTGIVVGVQVEAAALAAMVAIEPREPPQDRVVVGSRVAVLHEAAAVLILLRDDPAKLLRIDDPEVPCATTLVLLALRSDDAGLVCLLGPGGDGKPAALRLGGDDGRHAHCG